MHVGVGELAALMDFHLELFVDEVIAVAAVRRHHVEGCRLEALESVRTSRSQPA